MLDFWWLWLLIGALSGALLVLAARRSRPKVEQQGLDEQFHHDQRMEALGRLAGGVAHDFNNLLTVILGYSEVALQRLPSGSPAREDLEEISRAGQRAAALTGQLLAFSRRQPVEAIALDLNEVVGRSEKMLRRLVGEKIELVSDLASALGPMLGDPGQLEQVVVNLVVNARDAMPSGGRITLRTQELVLTEAVANVRPGPHVVLTVSDTGVGMETATRLRLFEPFFTTKAKGRGTGLGLSMVYGTVRSLGGQIVVESERGRGTTFTLTFPRTDAPDRTAVTPPRPALRLQGQQLKVLVVEDDERIRALVSAAMRENGFDVISAGDAEKAEQALQGEGDLHLLITDAVLPGRSGPQFAAALLARRPQLRVLYMTGYTESSVFETAELPREAMVLQKPFTMQALLLKVQELLGEPHAASQRS